jgi:hypothetical protein
MAASTFDTWLRGSRPLAWDPETNAWSIGVGHHNAAEWLQHRLLPSVQRALAWQLRQAGAVPPGAGGTYPEPQLTFQVREPAPLEAASPPESDGGQEQGSGTGTQPARQDGTGSARGSHRGKTGDRELAWTDIYIKVKVALRENVLSDTKGAPLSVLLCLGLHMDRDRTSAPGIKRLVRETGYARGTVCRALKTLASPELGLVTKLPSRRWGNDRYRINGYFWFGSEPAPALFELDDRVQ